MLVLLFISPIALFFLLLLIVPKGNLLYELLQMPGYWINMIQVNTRQMKVQRYKFGKNRRQYLLFCQPLDKKNSKNNIILYFHGGGWAFGSPQHFIANAQQLVHQGYYVIMPAYRRTPWYSYYDIREDLTLTLKKTLEIMKEYRIENKNFIFGGMSAGGNLAALMSYNPEELAKCGISKTRVKGGFYTGAPLDLSKMRPSIPLWLYAGRRSSQKFRDANPINHIDKGEDMPVLIIHGLKDGIVEYDNVLSFAEKLNQIHPKIVKIHTVEDGGHLDAVRWSYQNNEVRKALFKWLEEREE